MGEYPSVFVTIVTFNSSRYIERCLEGVRKQDYPNLQIVIVDNASTDSTCEILKAQAKAQARDCTVIYNGENTGFAAAQNQAIEVAMGSEAGPAGWVLALNPDVLLTPAFVGRLVAAGAVAAETGTVCGKLLSISPDLQIPTEPIVDSTGIFLTRSLRHLDRGSRLPDTGEYDRLEYVFGATGAAALYRCEMVNGIAVGGEFFDTDFFAYREDADVAWRAQLLGWKCLYVPDAVGYHVRSVVPENRRSLPAHINMHSVKNRWLLRMKNMTGDLYRRYWLPITIRDLIVTAACFTIERSSLPAFAFVFRHWKRIWAKRREIMKRRRAEDWYMRQWISDRPASFEAPHIAAAVARRTLER